MGWKELARSSRFRTLSHEMSFCGTWCCGIGVLVIIYFRSIIHVSLDWGIYSRFCFDLNLDFGDPAMSFLLPPYYIFRFKFLTNNSFFTQGPSTHKWLFVLFRRSLRWILISGYTACPRAKELPWTECVAFGWVQNKFIWFVVKLEEFSFALLLCWRRHLHVKTFIGRIIYTHPEVAVVEVLFLWCYFVCGLVLGELDVVVW